MAVADTPSGTWWVEPGHFLAGPYPLADSDGDERLDELVAVGIRTVISLLDETQHHRHYPERVAAAATRNGCEVDFHHVPIPDFGTVDAATYRRIIETIDSSIVAERPVYLHCWGGHGRTGTVVACWLRDAGMTAEASFDHIADLRSHDRALSTNHSPETKAQRQVAHDFGTQD